MRAYSQSLGAALPSFCGKACFRLLSIALTVVALFCLPISGHISSVRELVDAVAGAKEGATIMIGPGEFEIPHALKPAVRVTIRGAGMGKSIITAASSFAPGIDGLPQTQNPDAYLFSFDKTAGIIMSDMTLRGPWLHGAIFANDADSMELYNLRIEHFLWCGIRTFQMDYFRVHDNHFHTAGNKIGNIVGAALFMSWTNHSEFWNNRITSDMDSDARMFGFKGEGGNHLRFHHNSVEIPWFALEIPHKNNERIEIDHNMFCGPISVPKYGGGRVVEDGFSFHIHHNWLRKSYAVEGARNSLIVEYNLFDFDTSDNTGNLITNHGSNASPGPTIFRNNLVKNPGRGLFWTQGVYNQISFHNNHVKANTLSRQDGFFRFAPETDFATIEIRDNILENTHENPRPLMRTVESYAARIHNNELRNISDTDGFSNPATANVRGPKKMLYFHVGVNDEFLVDGWHAGPAATALQPTVIPARPVHHGTGRASEPIAAFFYTLQGRRVPVVARSLQTYGAGIKVIGNDRGQIQRVILSR